MSKPKAQTYSKTVAPFLSGATVLRLVATSQKTGEQFTKQITVEEWRNFKRKPGFNYVTHQVI